ncbi:CehA/McbA family metallohydrolase [Paenibacillus timonensis]|uniref:CehA/McbA family metallohydrolase n=1 Tax=Paenibacillus timonensis TaxID=225915 RepID=A0ABW3S5Z1_9BACL|nr:CehA/McbA family metallohydrolase [Paenibacillus timonensis]MCH1638485.1 CehA/McbA family metallohydrolase [Paenibacillus timonensis]
MKWLACELHTHTLHSDGVQTLEELAAGAAQLGFDAIALMDHNTMSGLAGKDSIASQYGLMILSGMEWTTFYGHMVTIGLSEYADWRRADRSMIDEGIQAVHRLGGIAGLAHPFRIGSPACTGCFWEYELRDWSVVDYIEVWSGTFASIRTNNRRAYTLWTDKLNEGLRISATSGRDWHAQSDTDEPLSVTYLGIPEGELPTEERLINALREGRAAVTMGPLLSLTVSLGGQSFGLGSVIPSPRLADDQGEVQAHITIDFSVRLGLWSLPEQNFKLVLCSDLGMELEMEVTRSGGSADDPLCLDGLPVLSGSRKWLRAELWGMVREVHALIAFTNPVYFE